MTRDSQKTTRAIAVLILASLLPSSFPPAFLAQQPSPAAPTPAASETALPLPEDRGAAALEQSLRRLSTWASLMFIVAHPDDEDGAMLTWLSRGQGVRTSLLTLTRGEGGQNAMSADTGDALGIMRTTELLRAGEYYGVKQYWGTEADFGFSKTQEEAFARWGHDRVLFDTVLAIRRERPLVLAATFIGGVTDGHGQHQVSGEIAQEAYLVAGDPTVFPEQIAAGLQPWTPLKVYARVPFAPITDKGMFDYATGKWAPARFFNYVTKEWSTAAPTADVSAPSGQYDPVLGRTYVQIAREGWGEQKSQYGGANPQLSGPSQSEYHRYASRVPTAKDTETTFFQGIPTGIEGLSQLLSSPAPDWLTAGLREIAAQVADARRRFDPSKPEAIAPTLKAGCEAAFKLTAKIHTSSLSEPEKANLIRELEIKTSQFQTALAQSLALDLQAFTVRGSSAPRGGPFGGGMDETPRAVTPGQRIQIRIHTGNATGLANLTQVWLQSSGGGSWSSTPAVNPGPDQTIAGTVPANASPTQPYFTRPTTEQPYYDVSPPQLRGDSFVPYPLTAWAEFTYDGLPIHLGEVVQTMRREPGRGGVFQPLVVTPPIGVRVEPEARLLPIDGAPLPVKVTVHTEASAEGSVRLSLPNGWQAAPASAHFKRTQAGDAEPIVFQVTPSQSAIAGDAAFTLKAEAESNGQTYSSGWRTIGYPGLRPYNLYRGAELKTRAVNAKVSPGLRIGYIMGTGDTVPEAIEGLGITPHLLSASEIASTDLSAWDAIVVGIRAYSMRPELTAAQPRLNAFVQAGGTLIVQYQSDDFPSPLPIGLGRSPEKVVEENAPVKLLAANNPLLSQPNRITSHDFDGWVEERGHSFAETWDPAFTPLTETADQGQDPQRGGLLVAHPGKGTYIYLAYALYRQLPELVPGSYRLLANLLSSQKANP